VPDAARLAAAWQKLHEPGAAALTGVAAVPGGLTDG